MMQHPEFVQPSPWPFHCAINSPLDNFEEYYSPTMDSHADDFDQFSSLFSTIDTCSELSQIPIPSMFSGETVQIAVYDDSVQVMSPMEDLTFSGEIDCIWEESVESLPSQQNSNSINQGQDLWSPSSSMKSESTMDVTSTKQLLLTLPVENEEIENEVSVGHLLHAYGEAMEKKHRELGQILCRSFTGKVSPLGEAYERVAFNLSEEVEEQKRYLIQESLKNIYAAYSTFNQIFPYAKFAYFTAISAMLEAFPDDAETIHVIDHDLEGVQWAHMIEAAAQRHKKMKLTCVKVDEEETHFGPQQWGFEETKTKLLSHARNFGLKLEVKEVRIEDLVNEIKKTKKRGGGKEFLAFNCMVGLPHMRRVRSRKHVMEFLRVAKDLLSNSTNCKSSNRGIIVLGDGDPCEKLRNCPSFSPFFDGCLEHYQALLESMESSLPVRLAEARMAMECQFIWPHISSQAWYQKWEEIKVGFHLQEGLGLEGWRMSQECLMEAKEMVIEEVSYRVKIEGQNGNEMSLEWGGIPLVKVSAWINQI